MKVYISIDVALLSPQSTENQRLVAKALQRLATDVNLRGLAEKRYTDSRGFEFMTLITDEEF